MSGYQFMAEHPVLTVILALIIGQTLIYMVWPFRRKP